MMLLPPDSRRGKRISAAEESATAYGPLVPELPSTTCVGKPYIHARLLVCSQFARNREKQRALIRRNDTHTLSWRKKQKHKNTKQDSAPTRYGEGRVSVCVIWTRRG